jgi:hypothetical protein
MDGTNNQSETSSSSTVASSRHSIPPTDFPKFEKLPIELRLEIWKQSLPDSRILEIIYNKSYKKNRRAQVQCKANVPALLHACQESRAAGLKIYSELVINNCVTRTYVCWEKDIIFISLNAITRFTKDDMKFRLTEFSQKCRRFAISAYGVFYVLRKVLQTFRADTPNVFPNLEEIFVVQEQHQGMRHRKLHDFAPGPSMYRFYAPFLETLKASYQKDIKIKSVYASRLVPMSAKEKRMARGRRN